MTARVDAIIDRIGTSRRDIIPLLQALQDEFSYLPSDALLRVYERTEIDRAQLISVSTFYSQFRHVPYGKHIIKVCTGTACHVKGANNVYDAFRRELKMEEDRITTADQEYSIEKIACLGCCALAPVVQIDEKIYGLFLLFLGVLLLLLCLRLKEPLPPERRIDVPAFSSFRTFLPLFKKRRFMDYVFIQAFVFGMIFAYISSSPFVLQEHYRLSPLLYSLCFAVNAIALIIGTTLAGRFRHIRQGMVTGVIGSFVLAVFTGLTLWYEMPIAYFETALFLNLIFGGLVLPTSTALALDSERQNAGAASAVFGAVSFLAGGIVSPLVGIGNILHTTAIIMVVSSAIAVLMIGGKKNAASTT